MAGNTTTNRHRVVRLDDSGFTLIEILIAIVLVGILTAVAVVGISNLVGKGSTASCRASKDAATAAAATYLATTSAYPSTFTAMTANGSLLLASGVSVNTTAVSPVGALPAGAPIGTQASSGTSWYLTMTGGGGVTAPIFDCKP